MLIKTSNQRLNINTLINLVSYKARDTRYSIQEVEYNPIQINNQNHIDRTQNLPPQAKDNAGGGSFV